MPGGFTNRWVCVVKDGLDLTPQMIRENDGYVWSEEGEKFELRRLIKLDPPVKHDRGLIISGRMYFQREVPKSDYEITDEGEIREITDIERRTNVIPFWVSFSRPVILFKNSKEYTREGKKVLSNLLFGVVNGIEEVEFNIETIEGAWRNGEFDMWAYSFRNRKGTVNKGSLYSDNRINVLDPLYQDTSGAPRNFVGIIVTLGNREVKVRITRDGTITIYGNFEEITYQPTITNFIKDLIDRFRA